MSNQRKGNLTEERVQQLNALGFEWDQKGSKWNARYRELVDTRLNTTDAMFLRGTDAI